MPQIQLDGRADQSGHVDQLDFGDMSPSLSRDGLALYLCPLVLDATSEDSWDIWVARRKSATSVLGRRWCHDTLTHFWGLLDPCISSDGSTLFVASRGPLAGATLQYPTTCGNPSAPTATSSTSLIETTSRP